MITQLDREGFPVAAVCQALGVSRAGYYAHARGEAGPREREDARRRPLVRQIFWEHRRRYGARRIAARRATSTRASVMCSSSSQPTMRREYRSMSSAR